MRGTPPIGFGESIALFFKNYFNFKGRCRRSEFWYAFTTYFITVNLLSMALEIMASRRATVNLTLYLSPAIIAFLLITVIPVISLTVRRLHDIGKGGWHIFVFIIPLVGQVLFIVWLANDSDDYANVYGQSSKYPTTVKTAPKFAIDNFFSEESYSSSPEAEPSDTPEF